MQFVMALLLFFELYSNTYLYAKAQQLVDEQEFSERRVLQTEWLCAFSGWGCVITYAENIAKILDEKQQQKFRDAEAKSQQRLTAQQWLDQVVKSPITGNDIYPNRSQCDGYLMEDNCLKTNPRNFNQTGESVWCTYTELYRNITEFVCIRCPRGFVGLEKKCESSCPTGTGPQYIVYFQQDEIQPKGMMYQSKSNCVRQEMYPSQFPPNIKISSDSKSLVQQCLRDEFVTIKNVQGAKGVATYKQCTKCPAGKYINFLKNACVDTCAGFGQVADTRVASETVGYCIELYCNKISRDGLYCVDSCGYREFLNNSQCQLCPYNFPYVSANQLRCLKNCDEGFVFDMATGICISLDKCVGFLSEHDGGKSCLANCQQAIAKFRVLGQGFGVTHGLFVDVSRQKLGTKYQFCSFCPESTPFADENNPTKCMSCASPLIHDYVLGKCVEIKSLERDRVFSNDRMSVYPECPPGFYTKANAYEGRAQCVACFLQQISLPGVAFCCNNDQVFEDLGNNTFKCTPRALCNGFLSGNICRNVGGCAGADEFATVVEGFNYLQCRPCSYFSQPFASPDSLSCQQHCKSPTHTAWDAVQEGVRRCIPIGQCNQYLIDGRKRCTEMPKGCRVFGEIQPQLRYWDNWQSSSWSISYTKKASSTVAVKMGQAIECVQCPADQMYIEDTPSGKICSQCVDSNYNKIRNVGNGMCVTSVEQVSNAGSGVFVFAHSEFWPNFGNDISGIGGSFNWFSGAGILLRESLCPLSFPTIARINNSIQCVRWCPRGYVEETRTYSFCILPEECSLVLSRSSSNCAANACLADEIEVVVNATGKKQCQRCPDERPMRSQNNTCTTLTCSANQSISLDGRSCNNYVFVWCSQGGVLALNKKRCIVQCEVGQLRDEETNSCILPEKCLPKMILEEKLTCVNECPMSYVPIKIAKLGNAIFCQRCSPLTPYVDKDKTGQLKCVEKCNIFDAIDQRCIFERRDCKQVVLDSRSDRSFQCLAQCPVGYARKVIYVFGSSAKDSFKYVNCEQCVIGQFVINKFEQTGQMQFDGNGLSIDEQDSCVTLCDGDSFADKSIMKCISKQKCNDSGRIADYQNKLCVSECSNANLVHRAESTGTRGQWKFVSCMPADQDLCAIQTEKSKRMKVLGRETCFFDIREVGGLVDRINESELLNWSDCMGVISIDGRECLIACPPLQVTRYNCEKGGFYQCVMCVRHIDEDTHAVSPCLNSCRDGYVPNTNNICVLVGQGKSLQVVASNIVQNCIAKCQEGGFFSKKANKCMPCKKEHVNIGLCIPCQLPFSIFSESEGRCVTCAKGGIYSEKEKKCIACTKQQQEEDMCVMCEQENYEFQANLGKCSSDNSAQTIDPVCPFNMFYILSRNNCGFCDDFTSYSSQSKACVMCTNGKLFNEATNSCSDACTLDFQKSRRCRMCAANFAFSISLQKCMECPVGSIYSESRLACEECTSQQEALKLCQRCLPFQIYQEDPAQCVSCNIDQAVKAGKCVNCTQEDILKSQCKGGVCSAPNQYVLEDGKTCAECPVGSNYSLQKKQCVACWPDQVALKACQMCGPGQYYSSESKKCVVCKSTDTNCTCSVGGRFSETSGDCVPCTSKDEGCTPCANGGLFHMLVKKCMSCFKTQPGCVPCDPVQDGIGVFNTESNMCWPFRDKYSLEGLSGNGKVLDEQLEPNSKESQQSNSNKMMTWIWIVVVVCCCSFVLFFAIFWWMKRKKGKMQVFRIPQITSGSCNQLEEIRVGSCAVIEDQKISQEF